MTLREKEQLKKILELDREMMSVDFTVSVINALIADMSQDMHRVDMQVESTQPWRVIRRCRRFNHGRGMTEQQEKHLLSLHLAFGDALDDKYRAGQTEHGGDLWTKPQAENIVDEAVDLVAYSLTMREQLRAMREVAVDGDLDKLRALALRYC